MNKLSIFLLAWVIHPVLAQQADLYIQRGHSNYVFSFDFSSDEKLMITNGYDKTTRLWEIASGRELATYTGIEGKAIFSPNNKLIISKSDNILKVWDVATKKNTITKENHKYKIKSLDISESKKLLLSSDSNGELIIWNVDTFEPIRKISLSPIDLHTVKFIDNDKTIMCLSQDKEVSFWNSSDGSLIDKFQTVEKTEPTVISNLSISPDGQRIAASSTALKGFYIWTRKGELVKKIDGFSNSITDLKFSKTGQIAISTYRSFDVSIWDSEGNKLFSVEKDNDIKGEVACLEFINDGNILVGSAGSYVQVQKTIFWDMNNNGKAIKSIQGNTKRIDQMEMTEKDDFVIVEGDNDQVLIWDTALGVPTTKMPNHGFLEGLVGVNVYKKELATYSFDHVSFWDFEEGNKLNDYPLKKDVNNWPKYVDVLKKQMYYNMSNFGLGIWDLPSNRLIRSFIHHNKFVDKFDISGSGKYLATYGRDNKLILWDHKTARLLWTASFEKSAQHLEFSNNETKLAATSTDESITYGFIKIYDVSSGSHINTISTGKGAVHHVAFTEDDQFLLSASQFGVIQLRDASSGKLLWEVKGHEDLIQDAFFIQDDTRIISSGDDGTIKIWEKDSGKPVVTMIGLPEGNYATVLPNDYYRISKSAHKYLHYVNGLEYYTFENFDLTFNRPDLVAQALGNSNQTLIDAYYSAYLKRLKKMGFTKDQVGTDRHLPELEISSDKLPRETNASTLVIPVKAKDTKYKLNRINLYINGVPVYGSKGESISNQQVSSLDRQITVKLSEGNNQIQLSVHNEKGVESIRKSVSIFNTNKASPATYVVSIGISDYLDNNYDLNYAAKDAKDIATKFGTDQSKVFAITDGNAVKEKILAIKNELMKSNVDDRVILFVAGHGLLDDNLDYFIGMHDVDFENPSVKGLPYEDLEGLLDGIPARKKIMFIDACHSGEVDKDDAVIAGSTSPKFQTLAKLDAGTTIASRGFKAIASKSESLGLENSFELMQELFADLRKGTGAVVISSASGAEFALESDVWKNGVFTYSILEGLENRKCDANKNGTVEVSELKNYVFDRVSELTNGKQHPTSRRENLEYDFVVW